MPNPKIPYPGFDTGTQVNTSPINISVPNINPFNPVKKPRLFGTLALPEKTPISYKIPELNDIATRVSNKFDSLNTVYSQKYIEDPEQIKLTSGRYKGASISKSMLNDLVENSKKYNYPIQDLLSRVGRERTFEPDNPIDLVNDHITRDKYTDPLNSFFNENPKEYNKYKDIVQYTKTKQGSQFFIDPEEFNQLESDRKNNLLKSFSSYTDKLNNYTSPYELLMPRLKNTPVEKWNPGDSDYKNKIEKDKELIKKEPAFKEYLDNKYKNGGEVWNIVSDKMAFGGVVNKNAWKLPGPKGKHIFGPALTPDQFRSNTYRKMKLGGDTGPGDRVELINNIYPVKEYQKYSFGGDIGAGLQGFIGGVAGSLPFVGPMIKQGVNAIGNGIRGHQMTSEEQKISLGAGIAGAAASAIASGGATLPGSIAEGTQDAGTLIKETNPNSTQANTIGDALGTAGSIYSMVGSPGIPNTPSTTGFGKFAQGLGQRKFKQGGITSKIIGNPSTEKPEIYERFSNPWEVPNRPEKPRYFKNGGEISSDKWIIIK